MSAINPYIRFQFVDIHVFQIYNACHWRTYICVSKAYSYVIMKLTMPASWRRIYTFFEIHHTWHQRIHTFPKRNYRSLLNWQCLSSTFIYIFKTYLNIFIELTLPVVDIYILFKNHIYLFASITLPDAELYISFQDTVIFSSLVSGQ